MVCIVSLRYAAVIGSSAGETVTIPGVWGWGKMAACRLFSRGLISSCLYFIVREYVLDHFIQCVNRVYTGLAVEYDDIVILSRFISYLYRCAVCKLDLHAQRLHASGYRRIPLHVNWL